MKFGSKVRTGGSAGWDDSAVETSLGDDVNLDGWVATRIVDRSSVDLGDCHVGFLWWGNYRQLGRCNGGRDGRRYGIMILTFCNSCFMFSVRVLSAGKQSFEGCRRKYLRKQGGVRDMRANEIGDAEVAYLFVLRLRADRRRV